MSVKGRRDYRPRYHFTPETGWINDPNGLVFDGKQYHLFAQHNPRDTKWGPMHWLHAVSDDLLRWKHMPIALYPDGLGMCFSGSACVIDGKIALMYTSHGEHEQQSVAFSDADGNFIPYAGNPVIPNRVLKDYRDPKLFWNRQRNMYGAAVAAGEHVELFASKDLIRWERTGGFSDQARVTGIHECPDIFPMTAPNGETADVMIASMILPVGGNRTQYVLGRFDGSDYRITHPFEEPAWIDGGWDDYAPVTYWGTDERIAMGWAANWKYADRVPTGEYCGAMTLPRVLSLRDTALGGLRLCQTPRIDGITGRYSAGGLPDECFRMRVHADGDFAVTLKNGMGEKTVIGLQDGCFFIDRRESGECGEAWEMLTDYGVARQRRFERGATEMEIVLDVSVLEVFADGGSYAATMLLYPTSPYTDADGESCTIETAALLP